MSLKISETTVQVMRNVHTQFPSVAQKRHVLKLSIVPERQRLTPHTCWTTRHTMNQMTGGRLLKHA